MTEQIAKIYAKAAFEYAEKAGNLADWTQFLEKLLVYFQIKPCSVFWPRAFTSKESF